MSVSFTGVTSETVTTYAWTGTANLSASTSNANGVVRSNLFPAPNFESGVSPWTTGSAFTATQSSTRSHDGTYSMLLTRNTATAGNGFATTTVSGLTVGQAYTLSFWAYGGTGAYAVDLTNVSSGSTKAFTGAASWQRVSLTFVPSATSVAVYVDDNGNTSPTNGAALYVDSFFLQPGSTVNSYFDGSFPTTYAYTYGTVQALVIDGYQVSRQSRSVFQNVVGGGQDVWAQPAGLRSGTLTAIFTNYADAATLLQYVSNVYPVVYADSDVPAVGMSFMLSGNASFDRSDDTILLSDGTETYTWAVGIDFQEVAS